MIILPDLPYPYEALEPVVSATTMRTHHDKHHAKYVEETNRLATEKGLQDASLEAVIAEARRNGWTKLYNNAAQAWNHAFFWECMTPDNAPAPAAFAALKDSFLEKGAGHFASGWVWITWEDGKLAVVDTHDAANMVGQPAKPVLVCDLWEHAYYLDYKNDRAGFLKRWWDEVANWRFAEAQVAAAEAGRAWTFGQTT